MLWKVCITWATLLRQIHRTFAAKIRATVRHTCKGKNSGKMQLRNRHFVISGVLSHPPPTKIIMAVLYSSLPCPPHQSVLQCERQGAKE